MIKRFLRNLRFAGLIVGWIGVLYCWMAYWFPRSHLVMFLGCGVWFAFWFAFAITASEPS